VDTQTPVIFSDLSTRADDWAWDFGDGGISNHQDDEHQYSQTGTYTVTLTVTSAAVGACSAEQDTKVRSNYITVTLPVVHQRGSIYVQSSPAGATVYLDGALKSPLTPMTITDVTAGSYTIRVTKAGYTEKSQAVVVNEGLTSTVTLTLTQSQSGGGLSVTTVPSGATVYVDGTVKGVTPLTNVQLTTGQHSLRMVMTGYVDYDATFTITTGQTTPLTLTLVPSTNPSGKGSLQISSTPSDAAIYIDGVLQGPTPKTISGLSAGSHAVRVTKTGYVDYSAPITVIGGQTLPLKLNLVPRTQPTGSTSPTTPSQPGGVGTIAVESNPPGANVYLDGKPSGTTPVTIPDVNAGSHTILLTMQGYSDASKSIDVAAGSQNQVSMDLHAGSKTPGFEAVLSVLAIAGLVVFRMQHRKEK
jgi:PKD repeat protein